MSQHLGGVHETATHAEIRVGQPENLPVHTDNMIGDAKLGYDSTGHLTLDTGNVTLFNEQPAYDNLSKHFIETLKVFTDKNHLDFQNAVNDVKGNARQLFKAIHVYDSMRGSGKASPETLSALKTMIGNMIGRIDKIYPGVLDDSKLSEFTK